MYLSRGFQSSVENKLHFGLGNESSVEMIEIHWLDGKINTIKNPEINQVINVDYKYASSQESSFRKTNQRKQKINPKGIGIDFKHQENDFVDYDLQLLLPQKQSTKGTAIITGDINNDGLEDFFVGNSLGNPAATYIQNKEGSFEKINNSLWSQEAKYEDANALFFDADGDSDLDLYVVSAGYELKENSALLQDRLYMNNGKGIFKRDTNALPKMLSSSKAISAGDIDGDGDLDLFVGGNVIPGKYPLSPTSYLLLNDKGSFSLQPSKNEALSKIGMVSDALFTDYDNDDDLDLLVVGEWMAPTFFNNKNGSFTKDETISGLSNTEGWWFSISEADVDNDGYKDYVLGNLGKNNKFQPKKDKPLYIYAKDFDNNGSFDVALSKINEGRLVPVRGKECSSEQNPFLLDKIKTYKQFASLEMKDIYGQDQLKDAYKLAAYTFNSVVIRNKGGKSFEITALPNEAQIGPTLATIVEDINKDGFLDILGIGAMYDTEVETIRYDANFGYVLLGNNEGDFKYSNSFDPFIDSDSKDITKLSIKGKEHYVVVSNNVPLEIFNFDQ